VANILCDKYGSYYVRNNFKELLQFVKHGGDTRPWSYALSYPHFFERLLISEPQLITKAEVIIDGKKHEAISFIHTSGIWIVGSSPSLLNSELIIKFSHSIEKHPLLSVVDPRLNKPLYECYGFKYSNRANLGKLNFIWVVEEIIGKPNKNSLYLLTRCDVCGQTNPTGINLSRNIIYNGDRNKSVMYPPNTWNEYTIDDLRKVGLVVEKWEKKSLEKYMKQGLLIPKENDVKKLNIKSCKCQCINCGNMITYDADDCFV
jgi:hypothetical protein